tara:strand:- start:442 stop:789 length:348 start_codon:yes stop_codon:yes gene_type:complete
MADKKDRPSVRAEWLQEGLPSPSVSKRGPRKNRMVKQEIITRRIGPDDPLHPDFMKGVYKTAQAGLDRVKRELAAEKLKKASKPKRKKKKLDTSKLKPRGAYSRKYGEREFKDEY